MKDKQTTNQCHSCRHINYPDGGHCYMFKTEPKGCLIYSPILQSQVQPVCSSNKTKFNFDIVKDIIIIALAAYTLKPKKRETKK